eukprot:Tamp_09697.p1 GENE.Tamp_09697~~Tamp_09697.p1  ORF type:complete len:546 (+),score=103.33 Tamp_09697:31-1638(+)
MPQERLETRGASIGADAYDSGLNWNPLPRRRPKQQATSPPGSGGGAMFGPGISWEADAPNAHTIGGVLDLIDENGMDVSGSVVSGSLLTHVDEMEVANFSQQTVDKMLAGARNSTVTVCIFNPKTQSEMTLELRRHAPEVVGRASPIAVVRSAPTSPPVAPLTPTEPIPQSVTEFEAAGNTLTPPGQAPESVAGVPLSELMKARAADDRGTLGVRIAMSMEETDLAPTQIQTVVPGSVAYAAGALQEGDDIVAIDGVPVSEHDIIPVIIGSNVIGSPCCLTVNRKGREFDVQLIRSSALRLQETDDVLVMLDDLAMSIDREMRMSGLGNKVKAIKSALITLERRNCEAEGTMYRKITQLAAKESSAVNSKRSREEEKKVVDMAMRIEELAGSLQMARTQRDDLQDENARLRAKLKELGLNVEGGVGGQPVPRSSGEPSSYDERRAMIDQLKGKLSVRLAEDGIPWDDAVPILNQMSLEVLRAAQGTGEFQPVLAKLKAAGFKQPVMKKVGSSDNMIKLRLQQLENDSPGTQRTNV